MTNRELLELAARAVGGDFISQTEYDEETSGYKTRTWIREQGRLIEWNPLTDDGDALRLAVKLKFNFAYKPQDTDNHHPIPSGVTVWLRHPASYGLSHTTKLPAFVFEQHHDEDHCAATRRAIVRAAAAIGEQMK